MTFRNIIATSALALVTAVGAASADIWRYAFEEALDEVQGKFAQKFKEEIEANSDHEIQLFPFGTLGESADTMEQAQSGILQFVDQSPGFTGALVPEAKVFSVPYLLPQDEAQLAEFFKTSKAINELFPPLYEDQGLKLLTMFPEGEVLMTMKAALDKATELARLTEAELVILTVYRHHSMLEASLSMVRGASDPSKSLDDTMREFARETADDARARAITSGVAHVSAFIRGGPCARTVVSFATERDHDLIVLGSRGLGSSEGYLLASVSHKVTSLSDIPVLIICA